VKAEIYRAGGNLTREILMADTIVGDIMEKRVFSVRENESLAEVYALINEHSFRHVPVVNDEHEVVGVISERDLLRTCVEKDLLLNDRDTLKDHLVTEVMTKDPEIVEIDTPSEEACRLMLENKFDCLPVVDGRRLVGIITTSDIMRDYTRDH
jgi:CBS domain-containing membrane protein